MAESVYEREFVLLSAVSGNATPKGWYITSDLRVYEHVLPLRVLISDC